MFWAPDEARWSSIRNNTNQPSIGKIIDDSMGLIERENRELKGVLPKYCARPLLLALGILVAAGVAAMLFLILLRRATSNTTRQ